MKYKCVNELDTFSFWGAQVQKCEYNTDLLMMEVVGVVAKYSNPCNETFADRYIDKTCVRFKNPNIRKFFLEGAKYYDANNVLQEEVADQDVAEDAYEETFHFLEGGAIFVMTPKDAAQEGKLCCEIAIDVGEEDTYWIEAEFDRAVLEWNNFLNKAQQEG